MEHLDKIDRHILKLLQENALLSVKEIANTVGLSVTPTYERIKRMEKNKYIDKYVALVNRDKVERSLVVFCSVSLRDHSRNSLEAFNKAINQIPEVMEIYYTSGGFDYMLKIVTKDMNTYQHFVVNQLATIENIATVQSSFVLKQIKCETAITLDSEDKK
ncbi:MAG TPA: Lrp/AsnC family transcriptional regulator [Luteibaculaceae bacterium]|nr:Lrp/AsnC family transcriptional regulator [Luteibaculaceae bacterium]